MPAFYKEAMRSGDEAPLLAAAPDHHLLFQGRRWRPAGDRDDRRLAARLADLPRRKRPLRGDDDRRPGLPGAVGGGRPRRRGRRRRRASIRHQFRDERGDHFTARLTIEFPLLHPRPHCPRAPLAPRLRVLQLDRGREPRWRALGFWVRRSHADLPDAHQPDRRGPADAEEQPGRVTEVNQEVEQMGGKVVAQYATLGEYDFVTVIEAPDERRWRRSRSSSARAAR